MNRILIVFLLAVFYVATGNAAPWATKGRTGADTLTENTYDVSVNYPDAEVLAKGPPLPPQPEPEINAEEEAEAPDANEDIETTEPVALEEPAAIEDAAPEEDLDGEEIDEGYDDDDL